MPATSVNFSVQFNCLSDRPSGHEARLSVRMHAAVLTAQPQLRDQRAVPLEVRTLQVVQQAAAATDHLQQAAS